MKNKMILPEHDIDKYIATDGKYCPYCESEDTHFMDEEHYIAEIRHEILCKSCHKTWFDVYTLSGLEESNEN